MKYDPPKVLLSIAFCKIKIPPIHEIIHIESLISASILFEYKCISCITVFSQSLPHIVNKCPLNIVYFVIIDIVFQLISPFFNSKIAFANLKSAQKIGRVQIHFKCESRVEICTKEASKPFNCSGIGMF